MKRLLILGSMLAAASAGAAQYDCTVTNSTFSGPSDLRTATAKTTAEVATSLLTKPATVSLAGGRVASIRILKDVLGAGKTVFQLQLFEDAGKKDFVAYVAASVDGLPNRVAASGQNLNPQTKLYDEQHLECVRLDP